MTPEFYKEYLRANKAHQRLLYAMNPNKVRRQQWLRDAMHPNKVVAVAVAVAVVVVVAALGSSSSTP
eukprot:4968262-Prymnesium_polylepis.1